MKSRGFKLGVALSCGVLMSVAAYAGTVDKAQKPSADTNRIVFFPAKGVSTPNVKARAVNITNHGGPVIVSPKVVFIFWGPSFSNATSPDSTYAAQLQAFRTQFGTTPEFNTITQYNSSNGTIALSNLGSGTADMFDTTTPPTNVTDAIVQSEVNKYLSSHTFDASTIYEVVLPSSSYSSSGTSTSCGGPHLAYCAYHSHFTSSGHDVKYSIEPYPSCSGCTVSGWTAAQNQEHFVCHETREAVTDPDGTTWWDRSGNEADDKCAWSPTPFIGTGSYGCQYEWSNACSCCVKTR
jgi:hypothetical protein